MRSRARMVRGRIIDYRQVSTQALLGVLRRGAGFVASAVSILGSAGSAAIVNGPCIDRFERRDGEWHFAERPVRTDLVADASRDLRRVSNDRRSCSGRARSPRPPKPAASRPRGRDDLTAAQRPRRPRAELSGPAFVPGDTAQVRETGTEPLEAGRSLRAPGTGRLSSARPVACRRPGRRSTP